MTTIQQSMASTICPAAEATEAGAQFVIAGYRPITQTERLNRIALLPMRPRRACVQKPCNIGLFDEDARNQLELF